MKHFEVPEVEIIRFAVADIITSSDGNNEFDVIPAADAIEDEYNISAIG